MSNNQGLKPLVRVVKLLRDAELILTEEGLPFFAMHLHATRMMVTAEVKDEAGMNVEPSNER